MNSVGCFLSYLSSEGDENQNDKRNYKVNNKEIKGISSNLERLAIESYRQAEFRNCLSYLSIEEQIDLKFKDIFMENIYF